MIAKILKKNESAILAYFYQRVTNAIAEGINQLIQAVKRKARVFRTFVGFECMIYLVVGTLKYDFSPLFL